MTTLRGPHPNSRVAMTAPRPRIQRLLQDDTESLPSSSSNCSDPEEIIRKNLFAPPAVVQNDIFRTNPAYGIMQPSYNRHYVHQPQNQQIHRQGSGNQSMARNTTPRRRAGTAGRVTRTGNDQFCGLSAQITQEISYRTPMKTPAKTKKSVTMMTPLSRDLFRAKTAAPMTDSKLMNIQLTKTASMTSSDAGSSAGSDPAASTKKRLPSNLLEATPQQKVKKQRVRKTPFPGKMSARKKLKRALTPPRGTFGSHRKARSSSAAAHTLSTSYDGVNDYKITSTEHDPSPFQVELPSKREVTACARICALMDGYTATHRDFNFAILSGVSRSTLEREYTRSTPETPMIAGSCHRDVVKTLLECADDVVVEGFFREYTEDKEKEGERLEACVFSSESLRQIVVCFRGSTANQAKPLEKSGLFGKQASNILHKEQPVPVLSSFQSAYFGTPLERTVFALLDNLSTRKPFFDVVMTGHSFGAAIATIAGVRYASSNSSMRVSCHAFGSPRIGGVGWRRLVHSVSNMRMYRTENANDPYISLPEGKEWVHCGHSIQMDAAGSFMARRFNQGGQAGGSGSMLGFVGSMVNPKNLVGSSQDKESHEIQSYLNKLTGSGDAWFVDFCEVKGKGVSGADNERRTLA